jgi:hypothetical protein
VSAPSRIADAFHRLSYRDRRALVLGLLILVPAALWLFAVQPYRAALAGVTERIAAERALLEREEALLDAAPTLPARLDEAARAAERAQTGLVRAANAPLAEAELTEYLEEMAALSRVLLQEIRGDAPDARAEPEPLNLQKIRLSVQGESDLEGVMTFLHRVENSPLLLRTVALSIEPVMERPPQRRRDDDDQPPPPQRPTGVMRFALVVEGFGASFTPESAPATEVLE